MPLDQVVFGPARAVYEPVSVRAQQRPDRRLRVFAHRLGQVLPAGARAVESIESDHAVDALPGIQFCRSRKRQIVRGSAGFRFRRPTAQQTAVGPELQPLLEPADVCSDAVRGGAQASITAAGLEGAQVAQGDALRVAELDTKMTNPPVEGINNKRRAIARRAYGFRSTRTLILMLL